MENEAILTMAGLLRARKGDREKAFAIFTATGGETTHGEHYERALEMALWMATRCGREYKKGLRVMIAASTGPDLLAAVSGSWLAGAVVAPVDAQQTNEGFLEKLGQLKPDIVLVEERHDRDGFRRRAAIDSGCRIVATLGRLEDGYRGRKETLIEAGPEDPALVIFTSGTSGASKGVLLSHRNLVVGGRNVVNAKGLTPSDRALCVLPLSHLNGMVTTYVAPLLAGGSVVYFQNSFNPVAVLNAADRFHCTWFSAVPTQYAALMKPPVPRELWKLGSLRFCRSASSKLNPRLRREFEAHYGLPIIETMGMTETTGQIFSNPVPPGMRKEGSVGIPLGFQARIVGEDGKECGIGIEGEIQVRGAGLMLGYLDNEAATEKVYDGGWLKSGDIGKRDAENYFYITGRKKDIAIFCGANISLSDLEQAVMEADLAGDISCAAEEDEDFGERVVAYVVAKEDASGYEGAGAAILQVLLKHLPSRLACKEVRFIDSFPRIGIGKIAKGKLPLAIVRHRVNLFQIAGPTSMRTQQPSGKQREGGK